MSGDEVTKRLQDAEAINNAFRDVSDMLNGAVATLIGEGWTDTQAREIVVTQWLSTLRQGWAS